ncbi:MAG: hypothetical protein EZS28_025018, partial [Streblomastix strix]
PLDVVVFRAFRYKFYRQVVKKLLKNFDGHLKMRVLESQKNLCQNDMRSFGQKLRKCRDTGGQQSLGFGFIDFYTKKVSLIRPVINPPAKYNGDSYARRYPKSANQCIT